MSIYESLLMECKDALQILRDEIKADPVRKLLFEKKLLYFKTCLRSDYSEPWESNEK